MLFRQAVLRSKIRCLFLRAFFKGPLGIARHAYHHVTHLFVCLRSLCAGVRFHFLVKSIPDNNHFYFPLEKDRGDSRLPRMFSVIQGLWRNFSSSEEESEDSTIDRRGKGGLISPLRGYSSLGGMIGSASGLKPEWKGSKLRASGRRLVFGSVWKGISR